MTGEIFLVDDNPGNLSLLAGILRGAGLRVRAANTGKRALAMIRAQRPELVMLDITMPEMDGYEVCRELKADAALRDIPVVFISALDEPLDKVKAFKAGGVDYVTKPFQAEEVIARVENQLTIWRLQRETESKNLELKEAYEQIRIAQDQISRLSASSRQLEDTSAWAAAMAAEVARSIGAKEIGVWALEEDRVVPLAAGGTSPPPANRLKGPGANVEFMAAGGSVVVPVMGMMTEPCGALVIDGPARSFGDTQRRVISGLAHHLGTALELRSLKRQLSEAEAKRAMTRRAMHERGIEALLVCPRCRACTGDTGRGESGPGARCARDGAELDASRILPFRVNERYRFERLLGEGGMGTVFAAYDEKLDRNVALKIIKAAFLGDPAMRVRLEREAKVIARAQHPGVTALFDVGELDDGSAFLVMELLKGRELSSLLVEYGAGTPQQVARFLRQTSAALAAAHRAGVIHRDVKPENIFLVADSGGFQAKLLDFGVALSARFEARLTQAGNAVGTPAYMSPEQVQSADLDERSDVYSLACVAWEAATGHKMVQGRQVAQVILKVLFESAPALSDFLPGSPPKLDHLFEAALAKSKLDRPSDIEAWATAVAELLERCEPGGRRGWPSQAWSADAGGLLSTAKASARQESEEAVETLDGPGIQSGVLPEESEPSRNDRRDDAPKPENVTDLLLAWQAGEKSAFDRLISLVHGDLHQMAESHLRSERAGHTLQPSAIVNETYLKLVNRPNADWQNRIHFFAVASRAMREILVDYARRRSAQKRGGGKVPARLETEAMSLPRNADLIAVDDALKKLAALDPEQGRVVELRFFGGLTIDEVAKAMAISPATVERKWAAAREWLQRELSA
ncbi:MAG TPA: ECF-type sigma factor [Thermoanaerobaculia bacterium]|nr:ECF-type sigma factor [Thermoanaerobaculia bacterium]